MISVNSLLLLKYFLFILFIKDLLFHISPILYKNVSKTSSLHANQQNVIRNNNIGITNGYHTQF